MKKLRCDWAPLPITTLCFWPHVQYSVSMYPIQRLKIVSSLKKCRVVLGWMYSYSRPKPQNLTWFTLPQLALNFSGKGSAFSSFESSLKQAENTKPEIQRRHRFADVIIYHL
jgi:hypothetical protein